MAHHGKPFTRALSPWTVVPLPHVVPAPCLAHWQAAMARRARLIVNAVGPFRFFGESVVQASIAGGCHYIDISGEPEFIEAMELRHGDAALAAGVSVVSSCGVDSVPADVGLAFCADAMRAAGFTPTGAESYVTVAGGKPVRA